MEPKYLQRWSYNGPTAYDSRSNYMGEDLRDYYIVIGCNRDSGCLDNSNFDTAWKELKQFANGYQNEGTDNEQPNVAIHTFNHWACGWYKLIVVHQNAPHNVLIAANDIRKSLDDYPILDEDDYSNRQYEQACSYWQQMSVRERIDAINRHGNRSETAFLAARFDDFSKVINLVDDSGSLFQYVAGD